MFRFIFRGLRSLGNKTVYLFGTIITTIKMKGNSVQCGQRFRSNGIPVVDVWPRGKMHIGDDVTLNNGNWFNLIGRQQPCIFVVRNTGDLTIGNNTGISGTAIVCCSKIAIGNYVKIGGNTVIYDTDFHSLDPLHRANAITDMANTSYSPVTIHDNVFIGAHSIILKGVTIGANSIVGAGSVVTKNIPPNEIWAGNPAKFIKSV